MTAIATNKVATHDLLAGALASRNHNTCDPSVTIASCATAEFTGVAITPRLVLVSVRGDIDLCSADALRDFARDQCGESTDVLLDLSRVQFFGTAGLAVFTGLERATRGFGRAWALVGGRPVHRLLRAVGQTDLFPCFEALDAALVSLGSRHDAPAARTTP